MPRAVVGRDGLFFGKESDSNGDEEFLGLGFNAFLPKPFEPEKFLEILRQQLI